MNATITTPKDMLSEYACGTIRLAINSRRAELLRHIACAIFAGQMDDEYGAGFWAKRIRDLNDAAIEFGMSYDY